MDYIISFSSVPKCYEICCYAYWESPKTFWKNFNCFNWQHIFNQVNSVRYLGILIVSTLSRSFHYTSDDSRFRSSISSMLHFGTLPPAVLCLLYSTFVLLNYCDVVWTPTTAKLTVLLERVHSKFVNRLPPSFHPKFSYTLTDFTKFQIFTLYVTNVFA